MIIWERNPAPPSLHRLDRLDRRAPPDGLEDCVPFDTVQDRFGDIEW